MIDAELRKRAEDALIKTLAFKGSEEHRVLLFRYQVIRDLLDAIEAHECKAVASDVSKQLRKDIAELDKYLHKKKIYGWCGDLRDLLAIADAKRPSDREEQLQEQVCRIMETLDRERESWLADAQPGWQDGPPKEPGDYGWVGSDGVQHLSRFHAIDFPLTVGLKDIVEHFRIAERTPPQREVVVKHKEGCEWEDGIIRNGEEWIIAGHGHLGELKFCPGCETKLPELEK